MVQRIEIVQEALVWYERALGDKGRAVDEIRALLEDTVPMLQRGICVRFFLVHTSIKGRSYDRGAQVHGLVLQFIDDVDRELGTLFRMRSEPE